MASGSKRTTRGSVAEDASHQSPQIEESTESIRRSSRRKNGKTALELLGVSPKKSRDIKSASLNENDPKKSPTKPSSSQDEGNVSQKTSGQAVKSILRKRPMKPSKLALQSVKETPGVKGGSNTTPQLRDGANNLSMIQLKIQGHKGGKSNTLRNTGTDLPSETNQRKKDGEESLKEKQTTTLVEVANMTSTPGKKMDQTQNKPQTRGKRPLSSQVNKAPTKKAKKGNVNEPGSLVESDTAIITEMSEENEALLRATEEQMEPAPVITDVLIQSQDIQSGEVLVDSSAKQLEQTKPAGKSLLRSENTTEITIMKANPVTSPPPENKGGGDPSSEGGKGTGTRKKKIVKAVIITASGDRKEVKLGTHVSTVKALEQILAGAAAGSAEDVAQLAMDVNEHIEATMRDEGTTQEGQSTGKTAPSTSSQSQDSEKETSQEEIEQEATDEAQTTQVEISPAETSQEESNEETSEGVAVVDSEHKIAYEALTQLASGKSKDIPVAINIADGEAVDAEWLEKNGLQVVPLENADQVWHRQMVGVKDKPMTASSGGLRARPEKHVVASFDLEQMVNRLQPDDDITNHIYKVDYGPTVSQMKCRHCDAQIMDRHDFRRHMTKHKDIEYKPWKCPICHYRAAVRAQIARHVNIHGELKPYVCKECGKGFNFKQKLVQHLKYHMDIRDKPCFLCNLAFHEHKTLKNHLRKIHNVYNVETVQNETVQHDEPAADSEPAADTEPPADNEQAEESPAFTTVENPESEAMETVTVEANTSITEVSAAAKVEVTSQDQNLSLKLDKKRQGRPSLLYGTRKTSLYTQQYKMGLLPAADRNNVPSNIKLSEEQSDTNMEVQEQITVATEQQNEEYRSQKSKVTSTDFIEPILQKYCQIDESDAAHVKYVCNNCEIETFTSRTGFLHHLEQKHPEIRAWQCSTCDYSCRRRSSLIVHMKIHTGVKDYKCDVCGKSFAFKQKLKNHLKHHMNLREYKCEACDKAFNEKTDLTKHIRKVHFSERDCVCEVCNKAFKDQIQLRRHADSHSGDTKKYLCEHCNKFYRSKVSLAQHMKSHTCMFHCEICDKNFGSYSGFMAHKVMHDESFEGYECEHCKKILHTKGSLTRHLAVAHSNDRPFSCNDCAKSFKTKKDLKNHRIVHSTERKYACEFCDFSSKRMESLRVHQRRHADIKPFQCGMCGKEYTQKHALETHLRHHTGYMEASCPICAREFFTRYQLDTHIKRKHSMTREQLGSVEGGETEAPVTVFMCEECNAVFMTQDSLAVHILAEHMKQGWGAGVQASATQSVGEMSESGLLQPQAGNTENIESGIANTVEVVTEAEATNSGGEDISTSVVHEPMAPTDFSEQTIELVSISEPGSSKQRVVSLIRPVDPQQQNVNLVAEDDNVTVQAVINTDQPTEQKLSTLLDPASNDHETFVAIADPSTNQEMLVAMPHANFESLLAASEIEAQNVGSYIDTTSENFITVSTADGQIGEEHFTIVEGRAGEGQGQVITIEPVEQTETVEEQQGYVTVQETIEIPIETESVTILDTGK